MNKKTTAKKKRRPRSLAEARSRRGEFEPAIELYKQTLRELEDLIELEGRRELRDSRARNRAKFANARRRRGELDAAVDLYKLALREFEDLIEREGRKQFRPERARYMHSDRVDDKLQDIYPLVQRFDEILDSPDPDATINRHARSLGKRFNETRVRLWFGDFLLFLKDAAGPYCVNLNIKSTRSEFSEPVVGVTPKTNLVRAKLKQVARHKVEEVLYRDVGIATVEVAADELNPMVVANLRQILLWQKRKHSLNNEQKEETVEAFCQGMESEASALEVMHALEVSKG